MAAVLPATHGEARKPVAIDYLKRIGHGGDVLTLFADDALCYFPKWGVYFPKWGVADGKNEIRQLFTTSRRSSQRSTTTMSGNDLPA